MDAAGRRERVGGGEVKYRAVRRRLLRGAYAATGARAHRRTEGDEYKSDDRGGAARGEVQRSAARGEYDFSDVDEDILMDDEAARWHRLSARYSGEHYDDRRET